LWKEAALEFWEGLRSGTRFLISLFDLTLTLAKTSCDDAPYHPFSIHATFLSSFFPSLATEHHRYGFAGRLFGLESEQICSVIKVINFSPNVQMSPDSWPFPNRQAKLKGLKVLSNSHVFLSSAKWGDLRDAWVTRC